MHQASILHLLLTHTPININVRIYGYNASNITKLGTIKKRKLLLTHLIGLKNTLNYSYDPWQLIAEFY